MGLVVVCVRSGLSEAGKAEFKRARPLWEKVQEELRMRLGNKQWNKLLNLSKEVTAAVTE
jgi:DNA-binding PadR family transcriptional regulator